MTDVLRRRPYDDVKRVLDILGAVVGLTVSSPVLAIVAILVAVKLGHPILFRQDRPGMNSQIFRLYKFRTMRNVDHSQGLVIDEQRLTPFGRALRSTSLDELPTLINVLRGDMSMVGPRPLLVQYLNRYTPEQAHRHDVRPGITGLAQVSGRNALSWEKKLFLDVEYVASRSFAFDALILRRTISSVFRREGISAIGHVTAPEFGGTLQKKPQG